MADSDDCAWDAEDFDPDAGFTKPSGDKWEGEDENLKVPVGEEKAATEAGESGDGKPKKSKAERIEEKKAARRKQEEEAENDDGASAEDEKARRIAMQRQADLFNALEIFGDVTKKMPETTEEFADLGKTLADQISKLDVNAGYVSLLENLVRHSCVSLDAEDCRRLAGVLTSVAQEKVKMSKDKKGPAKKKGKKLNLSKGARKDEFDLGGGGDGGGYDDEFDFM